MSFGGRESVLGNLFFGGMSLTEEEQGLLHRLGFVRKTYHAHSDITQEGDNADRTFFVESGWGCLYKILPGGERQIIDFPLKGDVIGLRGARGSVQRSFMAVTELVAYETSATALVSAMAQSVRLSEFIINEEARHKAILIEHLTNLGRRGARSRVAHLLLELGARLQEVALATADGYECPLTQYDLADALGLTAIHVNRMLRELREDDLVQFHKGFVEFIDEAGLRASSGFNPTYVTR